MPQSQQLAQEPAAAVGAANGDCGLVTKNGSGCSAADSQSFSAQLWQRVEATVFWRILEHPFLVGLCEGTLAEGCFRYYIAQDTLYLREYSRALELVSGRAPRREWASLFATCAKDACSVEQHFHKEFLEWFDVHLPHEPAPATVPSPTSMLYTAHLLSTIHERPFHEGLAAVLPCFMVYMHVGRLLKSKGSPHPLYQKWIDKYGGDEFDAVVRSVESMVDEVAAELTPEQQERMHEHMLMGCRMEYLFWDAAYHKQGWPI